MFLKFRVIAVIVVIAVLFLFAGGFLFAQSPRDLSFDTWVSGNLSEGEEIWFNVRPPRAGLLIVETSGVLDTFLGAYDASRNLIAENDDGGEDLNAQVAINADAGRTYLFKLKCYDKEESGSYSIRARMSSVSELRFDTWVSKNLSAGEDHWYSVRSSGVGPLIVETSGNLDTYLVAYDSSYNFIGENDDYDDDINARLAISAEAGKTYLFKLRGFDNTEAGPYRIRASVGSIPELRMGAWISGELAEGEEQWFSVRPSSAGYLTVETSGELDTYLFAYDASGNLLAEDDDNGEGLNARLAVPAEAGRNYIFRMKGFGSGDTGSYRIRASVGAAPGPSHSSAPPRAQISHLELEPAVTKGAAALEGRLRNDSALAVISIACPNDDLADFAIEELTYYFVNSSKNFTVVDRNSLNAIMTERQFQYSGEVDDKQAVAIGQMLGAQTVVTGSISVTTRRLSLKALDVLTARIVAMAREPF